MLPSVFVLALGVPLAIAHTETIHGAVVFSRHGDRTWKGSPPTKLTTVGQNQAFNSGSYWRSRYYSGDSHYRILNINQVYNADEMTAQAPDQPILVMTAQSFLQGLYPPASLPEELANGTMLTSSSQIQFARVSTIQDDSPESIWLKGDDSCPAYTKASERWKSTDAFKDTDSKTKKFYQSFYDRIFAGVLPKEKLSYANAYTIFDYVNVGYVHNKSIADAVTADELFQLRTLADSTEWAQSGDSRSLNDPLSISGWTLSTKVIELLSTAVGSKGVKNKFSLLVGSYDTFLAFFALANLPLQDKNFYGLPDYASTLSFELVSFDEEFPAEDNLYVRFLFRNGTEAAARSFALFGATDKLMKWGDFKSSMTAIGIDSVENWCGFCGSTVAFCKQGAAAKMLSIGGHRLSLVEAGVIGGAVVLGVFTLFGIGGVLAGFTIARRRSSVAAAGKTMSDAGSVISA